MSDDRTQWTGPLQRPAPPPPRRSHMGLIVGISVLTLSIVMAGAALLWVVTSYRTSPAPRPSTPTAFRNADEVVAFLADHGLPCGPVEHIDSPVNATSLIDCGPAVVVAVYASHAAAVAQFNSQASTMAGLKTKLHMAIGPNWTVSSDDPAYAENVAKLLTVEYRTT